MAAAAPSAQRWIFGPFPDLLLGCGVGYALLAFGLSLLPADPQQLLLWGALATTLIGMPHYGATLLRVYERREDRRRYAIFAVWATLVVWAVFVWSLYDSLVGSVFLTIYLTWSPWHYTGQNYGLAVMFLRRGGVELEPQVKRWLYASFILSYALVFLALHGAAGSLGYATDVTGQTYRFMDLAILAPVYSNLFPVVLLASLVAIAWTSALLLQRAEPRVLLPAALLVLTQAAWFSIPSAGLWWTGVSPRTAHVAFFFIWVAMGHAVQYLWITTYYAAGSKPRRTQLGYLGKTLLAGAGIWTVPALIFAPGLLGTSTYQLGLLLMVSSAVNVHHFILDGAIWKLRDGRVARILLAPPTPDAPTTESPRQTGWGRRAIWAICLPATGIAILAPWLYLIALPAAVARGDWATADRAESLLAWMGRAEPTFLNDRAKRQIDQGDLAGAHALYEKSLALHPTAEALTGMADVRLKQGDISGALLHFEKSIAMQPTPQAWAGVGMLRAHRGDPHGAGQAYDSAVDLDPENLLALRLAGNFWLKQGDRERAQALLSRAAELAPSNAAIRNDLERANGPARGIQLPGIPQ